MLSMMERFFDMVELRPRNSKYDNLQIIPDAPIHRFRLLPID